MAATVIPVWLGPDLSDYNLVCTPYYHEIALNQTKTVDVLDNGTLVAQFAPFNLFITLQSLHPLQRYSRQVFLTISCPPGIERSTFYPVISGDQPTFVSLYVNMTYARSNVKVAYPITVEGIGADGKKRTCTAIVAWNLKDFSSMRQFLNDSMLK